MMLRLLRRLVPAALAVSVAASAAQAGCDDAKPIFYLTFSSDQLSTDQLTDFVERVVGNRLRALPGVAAAPVFGGRYLAMRVSLDPAQLGARGLTPQDVEAALRSRNLDVSPGRNRGNAIEYKVQAGRQAPQEIADIVLQQGQDYAIRLADVATLELGVWGSTAASLNGREVIALGIVKQSDASLLTVFFSMQAALPGIRAMMPAGMQIEPASVFSVMVGQSDEE